MKYYLIIATILLTLSTGFFIYRDHQASNGDLNHDGKITILDLSKFLSEYKNTNRQ